MKKNYTVKLLVFFAILFEFSSLFPMKRKGTDELPQTNQPFKKISIESNEEHNNTDKFLQNILAPDINTNTFDQSFSNIDSNCDTLLQCQHCNEFKTIDQNILNGHQEICLELQEILRHKFITLNNNNNSPIATTNAQMLPKIVRKKSSQKNLTPCKFCNNKLQGKQSQEDHYVRFHAQCPLTGMFNCSINAHEENKKIALLIHMREKHSNRIIYPCSECKFITIKSHDFKRHRDNKICKVDTCKQINWTNQMNNKICSHCNCSFSTIKQFIDHALNQHSIWIYHCACNYATMDGVDFFEHKKNCKITW